MSGTISRPNTTKSETLKLNIGCGNNKIEGYTNIDLNEDCEPDMVADIKLGLPFSNNSVDEILFFHTIEHIEEKYHSVILAEFWRVLKPNGEILVSYPEFSKCAQNYIENFQGMKEFWKNTIYGLQRYPGDYHFALMETDLFVELLMQVGFDNIEYQAEKDEKYNTIVKAIKQIPQLIYEEVLAKEMFNYDKRQYS